MPKWDKLPEATWLGGFLVLGIVIWLKLGDWRDEGEAMQVAVPLVCEQAQGERW